MPTRARVVFSEPTQAALTGAWKQKAACRARLQGAVASGGRTQQPKVSPWAGPEKHTRHLPSPAPSPAGRWLSGRGRAWGATEDTLRRPSAGQGPLPRLWHFPWLSVPLVERVGPETRRIARPPAPASTAGVSRPRRRVLTSALSAGARFSNLRRRPTKLPGGLPGNPLPPLGGCPPALRYAG